MKQSFTTKLFRFADLSPFDLYEIMALRQAVFIVEQNCPYLDANGLDCHAWHFLMYDLENQFVVYSRLLPPDILHAGYASIGRVVNLSAMRGSGLGRFLMQQSIAMCNTLFSNIPIKIGTQSCPIPFYESLGFYSASENYTEYDRFYTRMILDSKE